MSAPKRWTEPDSQASDELRALMRYARARKPDEAQLASLTAAVLAELPQSRSRLSQAAASASGGKLAVLGLVVASAIAAAIYFSAAPVPALKRTSPTLVLPQPAKTIVEPPPAIEPVAPSDVQRRHEDHRRAVKPSHPVGKGDASSEVSLLQAARTMRAAAPERALNLLREHASRFPDSVFSEEREALRIEILQRIHPEEAARRLRDFDRRFPSSVYRQRIADSALEP